MDRFPQIEGMGAGYDRPEQHRRDARVVEVSLQEEGMSVRALSLIVNERGVDSEQTVFAGGSGDDWPPEAA